MKPQWKTLGEIAEINPPLRKGLDPEATVAFVPMAGVSEKGRLVATSYRPAKEVLKGYTTFEEGDVLLAKITPCMENGKAAMASPLDQKIGFGSTEFHVLRAENDNDPRFLFHAVWNSRFREEAAKNMTGSAGQKRVPKSFLEQYQIACPSPAEQKRLAAILDQADAIRQKRQQAIRLTDDFLRSVFLDFFGESKFAPTTIQSLIDDKTLLYHKDGNHGGLYPRATEFGEEGIPFISAKHIDGDGELNLAGVPLLGFEKARSLRLGWLHPKDVLLAHNATVGPCAMYDGQFPEALIGTSLTAFRANPKKLLPEFLLAALRSLPFQKQLHAVMSQTTRNQVPITAQRTFVISIPPLSMQVDFSRVVEVVTSTRRKQLKALVEAENLFQSLQISAFTGQL